MINLVSVVSGLQEIQCCTRDISQQIKSKVELATSSPSGPEISSELIIITSFITKILKVWGGLKLQNVLFLHAEEEGGRPQA